MRKNSKKNSIPTTNASSSNNARSKRRKSSSDVVIVVDQKSALAVKALGIVLQHMMMPNLGLNDLEKQSFESKKEVLKVLNTLPECKERDDAIASIKDSSTTTNVELSKIIAGNIKERVRNITDVRMTFNIQVTSLMFLFFFFDLFFVTASNHYE